MFDLCIYAVSDSYHYTKLRVIEFCKTSNISVYKALLFTCSV